MGFIHSLDLAHRKKANLDIIPAQEIIATLTPP